MNTKHSLTWQNIFVLNELTAKAWNVEILIISLNNEPVGYVIERPVVLDASC